MIDVIRLRQRGRVEGRIQTSLTYDQFCEGVGVLFNIPGKTIASRKRTERVSIARHALVWALYEHHRSFTRVGKFVGGRDHTTMMNSYRKAVSLITSSLEYRHLCELVLEMVRSEQLPVAKGRTMSQPKEPDVWAVKTTEQVVIESAQKSLGECTRTSPDIVAVDVFNSGKRWLVRFERVVVDFEYRFKVLDLEKCF